MLLLHGRDLHPHEPGSILGRGGREAFGKGEGGREGPEGGFSILMSKHTSASGKTSRTRFTRLVRIDPAMLAWMQANKDTRTTAGYLDKIIKQHIRDREGGS